MGSKLGSPCGRLRCQLAVNPERSRQVSSETAAGSICTSRHFSLRIMTLTCSLTEPAGNSDVILLWQEIRICCHISLELFLLYFPSCQQITWKESDDVVGLLLSLKHRPSGFLHRRGRLNFRLCVSRWLEIKMNSFVSRCWNSFSFFLCFSPGGAGDSHPETHRASPRFKAAWRLRK